MQRIRNTDFFWRHDSGTYWGKKHLYCLFATVCTKMRIE